MQKPEGLVKAAAMMAVMAALATMLAVNVAPPRERNARQMRGQEMRMQRIPGPRATPKGGAGAAQGRGAAVERREAGGSRAPK